MAGPSLGLGVWVQTRSGNSNEFDALNDDRAEEYVRDLLAVCSR